MRVNRGRKVMAASLSCALFAVVMPPLASAQPPVPTAPGDASVAAQWGANSARSTLPASERMLSLSIDSVSPYVVQPQSYVSVTVTVRNTSDHTISDIALRMQRGERLHSVATARTVLATPEGDFSYVTDFVEPFTLRPQEQKEIKLTASVSAPSPEGLGIAEAGVYPLLVNANGSPGDDIVQFLSETRTLLPVKGDTQATDTPSADTQPTDTQATGNHATDAAQPAPGSDSEPAPAAAPASVPLTLVWPLAQKVPVVPGETGDAPNSAPLILSDESLAESLQTGGRLDQLLRSLESAYHGAHGAEMKNATCVAIDPETIDAVSRMTNGYWVAPRRPSPVQKSPRLRDSWGSNDNEGQIPGTGAAAAREWLDRLHAVVSDGCVMTLPWSSAELNAVIATNDTELISESLLSGPDVVEKHTGVHPVRSLIVPPENYLSSDSIATLNGRSADLNLRSALGDETAIEQSKLTALLADNSMTLAEGGIAKPGESASIAPNVDGFALPGALTAALAATGDKPELAGFSAVAGRYDLTADSAAARLQTAVGTLHQEIADAAATASAASPDVHSPDAESAGSNKPDTNNPNANNPDTHVDDSHASGAASRPIVAMPPTGWSVSKRDADTWLRVIADSFESGRATPMPLHDAIGQSQLNHNIGTVSAHAPNPDPGAVPNSEVTHARQLSRDLTTLTNLMADDPNVTLTRHGFTLPLRRDILRSLSSQWRRNADEHVDMDNSAKSIRSSMGAMVQRLRNSVSLVTPGGMFTRATGLSPIVVLGRNGLPLPVPVVVKLQGNGEKQTSDTSTVLPAKGSVTIQLDAQSHGSGSHTNMDMWLQSPEGTEISTPTNIAIRSGISTTAVLILTGVFAAGAVVFGVARSRRFRK